LTYVLSHTHWDREWFVTHEYTRKWIVDLMKELFKIFERHPDFEYILDGQTLLMEDLWKIDAETAEKAVDFIKKGNLKIGPVYAQIDWRISLPQAIWKDFEIGEKDCERYSGCMKVGWFMDNFGQISQLPQIMNLFGIKHAFIWRGLRETFPAFIWKSPDGSEVKVVALVGGYRTLYNLMDTREIAEKRFEHEAKRLGKLGEPVVLMDGYDLDIHPEDPRDYLKERFSTSLESLLEEIDKMNLPVIKEELISGKIASVFPGTLSTRSYLKIGSDIVGKLLTAVSFLTAFIGESDPDDMWRDYLKTLVHDNICGVGVDQIHEEMEEIYRSLYESSVRKIWDITTKLSLDGKYVFSPSEYHGRYVFRDEIHEVDAKGVGFWKVVRTWKYEKSGTGDFKPFKMILERESGDTYSSHCGPMDFEEDIRLVETYKVSEAERYVFERKLKSENAEIKTIERYDRLGEITWLKARITPKGCCYRVSFLFDAEGEIFAGMPFDVVKRKCVDRDLFDESEDLEGILLAAREVGQINEFPMQDFVAVVSNETFAVLTKGMRSYVCEDRRLKIPVIRSVEWITRSVEGRSGDAGPKMYVPGARSERTINVEIITYSGKLHPKDEKFLEMVKFLTWPRIIIDSKGVFEDNLKMFEKGSILPGVVLKDSKIKIVDRTKENRRIEGKSKVDLFVEEFPFGEDESIVGERILEDMRNEIEELIKKLKSLHTRDIKTEHEYWTTKRTIYEIKLSLILNEMKALKDKVRDISFDLNEIRRKKRTYDYLIREYLKR
jgi:alpha-mannosidase